MKGGQTSLQSMSGGEQHSAIATMMEWMSTPLVASIVLRSLPQVDITLPH